MDDFSTHHALYKAKGQGFVELYPSPTPTVKNEEVLKCTERFMLDEPIPQEKPVYLVFQTDNIAVPLWTLDKPFQLRSEKTEKTMTTKHKYPRECEHCGKLFTTPQGLGGHTAKVHAGSSWTYNQKKATEKQRIL